MSSPSVRFLSIAFTCAVAAAATPWLSAQNDPGLSALRADALKEHVYFLASDEMAGRDSLSPEGRIAQDTWDRINYPKMEKITRLVYLSARHIADAAARPRFVPGATGPTVSTR